MFSAFILLLEEYCILVATAEWKVASVKISPGSKFPWKFRREGINPFEIHDHFKLDN